MSLPLSSSPALPLPVLSLLLLTLVAADGDQSSTPIVASITKDPTTSLYTIPVERYAPMVLDLAGPLVWSTCPKGKVWWSPRPTVPCNSKQCKIANMKRPAGCASAGGGQPGSTVENCNCTAYAYHPVTRQCISGDLSIGNMNMRATDGQRAMYPAIIAPYEVCVNDGFLASLPKDAAGFAGLSRLPLSLPFQVAAQRRVAKEFALCLPSDGQKGVAIFGGGPFQLQSAHPQDLAEAIRQNPLPLLKNPKNGAYYFGVHGIAVNQKQVDLSPGALDLDTRHGKGGVMFSTVAPCTKLRDDIFLKLINAFNDATQGIPRRKPPPPFELCYEASAFETTRVGPGVANIDLMLDGGRNWTLPGASSLVQVGQGMLCFAFHRMNSDNVAIPYSPAIIFGAHQMADNVVLFNPEKSTFGFSGLLLGQSTNCGNFEFGDSA
ncbi:hypothetical protein ACP4OV_024544 [Aristida adscensionis]